MSSISTQPFTVNGRPYHPPARPLAVICLDGSADEYLDAALARGRMPNLQRVSVGGYRGLARGAMPSFTNVNNASIVTGVPPSVHGIGGNFFYDSATRQEVMMNSARFLRAETIFPAAARAGRKVAVVTAKEKLRDIFAAGLVGTRVPFPASSALEPGALGGIAFSSEKADQAQLESHGVAQVEKLVGHCTPPIYSAEASLFVLRAGVALLENGITDFLYLSTTDYMQHKYAPDTPEAVEFYAALDHELGRLLERGAILGITADHGMNAKQKPDGSPNVIYLESELTKTFGPGFRVILPITDPYVLHHGALGSFAVIHLPEANGAAPSSPVPFAPRKEGWLNSSHTQQPEARRPAPFAPPSPGRSPRPCDGSGVRSEDKGERGEGRGEGGPSSGSIFGAAPAKAAGSSDEGCLLLGSVRDWLSRLCGVTEVYDRETAARKLELPADRLGELVVLAGRDVVFGRTPEHHDLQALEGGLRSHGGRYEEMVPFVLSEPLKLEYAARAAGDPRNFDIFDFTVNGTRAE